MGVKSRQAWAWLSLVLSCCVLAASAHADDFDDDFAEGPSEEAAPTPSSAEPDPFEDDFAEPSGEAQVEAAPQAATEGADFEDDFAKPAADATPEDTAPEDAAGERSVACSVVDAVEANQERQSAEERARRRRALRSHSSYLGPTGGIHAVDAGGGAEKSFRFAFGTQFFRKDGFLVANDDASRAGGRLAFAISPRPYLEIAASVVAYATANDQEDPDLFQVLGDMHVFGRGFHRVLPWLTVGGDLELAFLNGVGGIGIAGKGTSVGLRANASADLRELDRPRKRELPLIFRTNLRYYFDNSSKLVSDVEAARYANLVDPLPPQDETRHLLTNVERYAFNINRVDSFSMTFGIEAPLNVKGDYHLHPILEWGFDVPVNRQGYDCVYRPGDPAERDSCLAEERFAARNSTLSVGLRFLPPVKGFSVMTGFDIGTTGTRKTVRELSPNSPWLWMLGMTYTYDLKPEPPEVYTRTITVTPEAEPVIEGRVRGTVVEADSQAPIAGAAVHFEGHPDKSALLTDGEGHFVSYRLSPGPVQMQLESDGHHAGSCQAELPEDGSDVEVTCTLEAQKTHGSLRVSLRGDSGAPIAGATVRLTGGGGATHAAVTDDGGEALLEDLPVASYVVSAEPKGFLAKRTSARVRARATTDVELSLLSQPRKSALRQSAKRLVPRSKVRFEGDSARIDPRSHAVLAEVADYMIRHPEVRLLEVQRHSDNAGGPEAARTRSQRRAEAIRNWLVDAGVEPERLKAVGHGAAHPIAPNITPSNRARNRRVVFEIAERE